MSLTLSQKLRVLALSLLPRNPSRELNKAEARLGPVQARVDAVTKRIDQATEAETQALQKPWLDAFQAYQGNVSENSAGSLAAMKAEFYSRAASPASQASILDHALRNGWWTVVSKLGEFKGSEFHWPPGIRPSATGLMYGIQSYENSTQTALRAVVISGFALLSESDQVDVLRWMSSSKSVRLSPDLAPIHAAKRTGDATLVGPSWPSAEAPPERAQLVALSSQLEQAIAALQKYRALIAELGSGRSARVIRSDVTASMVKLAQKLVDVAPRAALFAEMAKWEQVEKYAATFEEITEGLVGINEALANLVATYDTSNTPDEFREAALRLQDDAAAYVEATLGMSEKIRLALEDDAQAEARR